MIKLLKSFILVINHPNNEGKFISTTLNLILWKINQLTLKVPLTIDMAWGVKFRCYPDSSWGGLVLYTRLPEYFEMKFVKKVITKKDIVIDVGANLGSYTLIAASNIDEGKVYAFEPSSLAYKRLLENISLNNFENKIISYKIAVSDMVGKLNFNELSRPEVSHVSYTESESNKLIESVTLDDLVKREKIKKIRLIKIDVEGYEYKVLIGASEILKKGIVDYILIEANKDSILYGTEPSETLRYLISHGFKLFYFKKSTKLIPAASLNFDNKTINLIAIHKSVN